MKLVVRNRAYVWEPLTWVSQLFRYGRFKKVTLAETESWDDVLGIFLRDVPEDIPVKLYIELQELRRDIGHYRMNLLRDKLT